MINGLANQGKPVRYATGKDTKEEKRKGLNSKSATFGQGSHEVGQDTGKVGRVMRGVAKHYTPSNIGESVNLAIFRPQIQD